VCYHGPGGRSEGLGALMIYVSGGQHAGKLGELVLYLLMIVFSCHCIWPDEVNSSLSLILIFLLFKNSPLCDG
jgi:hypothetical protein